MTWKVLTMCDEAHFDDDVKRFSRRDIGALASAAGLATLWPAAASATTAAATGLSVKAQDVSIPTPDGSCDAVLVAPAGRAAPAVLVWPDIFGPRPAFREMAQRLAGAGYAVLVVNPFYRQLKAPTAPQGAATPIAEVRPLAMALNNTTLATDAKALIGWLDARAEVDSRRPIGVIGYCMGGPMAVRTAATVPQRVGAVGSFHGGSLVTPAPDSPHRLLGGTRAQYLFAIAASDDEREPEAKVSLRQAADEAKRPAEIEVYPAAHGWCPPDTKAFDPVQAERAWQRLLALLGQALR